MKSICVFLGSNPGAHPIYIQAAETLGRELARRGLTCVYGGSDTGLMKRLADSVLAAGGKVIGVTVTALKEREIFHPGLTELYVMPTMNERKACMVGLADGFVVLPGGVGTFDEFFEVYAWRLLGFHDKPFGVLDVNGYFEPLDRLLDNAQREGFIKASYRHLVVRAGTPAELLDRLAGPSA